VTEELNMKHIISLGAGVQPSTMALMAAHGEITPMPDCAIFADTEWEPQNVYRWLEWLVTQLPFPVLRVRRSGLNLGEFAIQTAMEDVPRGSIPPWHLDKPFGMLPIQCSKEFKTRPVQSKIRELIGLVPRQRGPKEVVVNQWLGISLDEAHRMKTCEMKFVENRYPLIEQRMSRMDCLNWMEQKGYPMPPKSSCVFCPFHADRQWVDMRDNAPDDWQKAVEFDSKIRAGYHGMTGAAYVHPQRVPLDQVIFKSDSQPDMFGNECEGMCGV
jgi:hypothetical protein